MDNDFETLRTWTNIKTLVFANIYSNIYAERSFAIGLFNEPNIYINNNHKSIIRDYNFGQTVTQKNAGHSFCSY